MTNNLDFIEDIGLSISMYNLNACNLSVLPTPVFEILPVFYLLCIYDTCLHPRFLLHHISLYFFDVLFEKLLLLLLLFIIIIMFQCSRPNFKLPKRKTN